MDHKYLEQLETNITSLIHREIDKKLKAVNNKVVISITTPGCSSV